MDDNDGIPPLEDMSELVDRVKEINDAKPKAVIKSQPKESNAASYPKEKPKESGFGGMKKGFLFGGNPKQAKPKEMKKTEVQNKTDYVVKPKANEGSNLVFDDVQQAMKENQGGLLNNKDWINDDLLKNIEGNEKLFKQMTDPKFSQAVKWMQDDPQAAMEYYKSDKDVQEFFKEFYKLLGGHFTKLGERQDTQVTTQQSHVTESSPSASKASPDEEARMQKILENPEIREILSKPDIYSLFSCIRSDPENAQKLFQTADPRFKADVQKLVAAGLLNFQPR